MSRSIVWSCVLSAALALGWSAVAPAQTGAKKSKTQDVELKVVPKGQERSSLLLRPPGTDRYDPNPTDWSEVPPWRRTSFFGIRAEGQVFIYVIDCSGSMIFDARLVRAKSELRRSVMALQPPQRFKIVFYNDRPIPMPGDLPKSADLTAKDQMFGWLRLIEPEGETDPRGALGLAVALRPDAIFLLSDGEYPDGTAETIGRKNPRKVPIHCIDLGDGTTGDQLRRIAADSGGKYRWQPAATSAAP